MPIRIFANDINHLTDARYFAAWGADWMCYNPDQLSINEILAIKEWVEGPLHLVDISKLETASAIQILSHDGIDGVLIDSIKNYEELKDHIPASKTCFISGSDGDYAFIQHVGDVLPENRIANPSGSAQEIISFLKKKKPIAVALSGGLEEEVGVKDFEELDKILEWIEELDM